MRDDSRQQNRTARSLPCTLKGFEIENFQCIRKTGIHSIPGNCPWIFVTGENGDGKTSLLQALAIGLHGYPEAAGLTDNKNCRIKVEIQDHGVFRSRCFQWESDHWKTVDPEDSRKPAEPLRNILAYGPTRLEIQGELSMDAERGESSPVHSLLNRRGNLRNIEHWLKEQKLEAADQEGKAGTHILSRIEEVKSLLTFLMPHVSRMEIRGKNVFYWERGHKVPAHHLSAGHKSILAMIGDMLIRFFELQPDVSEPGSLRGIVIIDELEAHLHPGWQMAFPGLLSRTFPLVQFVASTHSVIPILGAPEGSVFLKVSRDLKKGTYVERPDVDVANLLPNSLLTSPLFYMDSVTSRQNRNFSHVRTEDDYTEVLRQKERDQRLQDYVREGRHFPEDFLSFKGRIYD